MAKRTKNQEIIQAVGWITVTGVVCQGRGHSTTCQVKVGFAGMINKSRLAEAAKSLAKRIKEDLSEEYANANKDYKISTRTRITLKECDAILGEGSDKQS